MTSHRRNSGFPSFKLCAFLAILSVLLVPYPAPAVSIDFLQAAEVPNYRMAAEKKQARRSADFSMDKHGDIVMHCLMMSITMKHNVFDESPSLREVIQRVHVQLTPSQNGVNVKVGYAF